MQVIEEGRIKGGFNGFKDEKTIFEMQNGSKWQQSEYKYQYHYEFMPQVKIIEDLGSYYLVVDSMNDRVLVQKYK